MKKLITLIAALIISSTLTAQTNCDCKADLKFVYDQMQTMSSYKSQIKGEEVGKFNAKFHQISGRVTSDMDKLKCYEEINKLMNLVKDKHASFSEVRPDFSIEDALDSSFVKEYRASESFKNFPTVSIDLGEIRNRLENKSINDVEGIYSVGNSMKIGVYRIASSDSLVGVMLSTKIGIWAPGQIFMYLKETDLTNRYDITAYGQVHKNLLTYKSHLVTNGILMRNVVKASLQKNHVHINKEERETYKLHSLNKNVQYVWLNSFSRFGNADKRDALVKEIKMELKADNLIVDLRNNGGGASKISLPIVKAIRKSGVKVFVLTNFASGSNAEQTTVRLKRDKTTVHLGQTTYGAIAYGVNYGYSYTSPSGLFTFTPTDMRFNHYLKYEETGVVPDVSLSPDSDWIEQTIDYINKQSL
ncbi:S41 family peptidase [Roseivirga sp.]|uniref:S41 family peptidase n=1 Tax=Roseivirga sp. TaxID=1964215 RepID=UPI003B8D4BD6